MTREEFINRVVRGEVYLTGGAVRDKKLMQLFPGFTKKIKDYDFMITGYNSETFRDAFPEAVEIGKGFPVFMLEIDGVACEVALARKEKKEGVGHRGFLPVFSENTTAEEDAARRETTMNQIFENLRTGEYVDYYHGVADMKNRTIRMTTEAFGEDPLRVLRASRQLAELAELKFEIDPDTKKVMASLKSEMKTLSFERVIEETKKALCSSKPSLFFRTLEEVGALEELFGEVSILKQCEQSPDYHPEGNTLEHTFQVVDAARYFARRMPVLKGETAEERVEREQKVVMGALLHDVGKFSTKALKVNEDGTNKFTYHGHEEAGVSIVKSIFERFNLKSWIKPISFMIEHHMIMHEDIAVMSKGKLVDFFEGEFNKVEVNGETIYKKKTGLRGSVDIDSFIALCSADVAGRCKDSSELDERLRSFVHPHAKFVREINEMLSPVKCRKEVKELSEKYRGEEIGYQIHLDKREQRIEMIKNIKLNTKNPK